MCVFFIFFTPVESYSKCIFHPPLFTPQIPHKKIPILKNHMCILSLINKFSAISTQILFILCNFHTPSIHPCYSINKWMKIIFLGGGFGDGGGNW